jgi:hypothetical protein
MSSGVTRLAEGASTTSGGAGTGMLVLGPDELVFDAERDFRVQRFALVGGHRRRALAGAASRRGRARLPRRAKMSTPR